jgi:hypothetical protein
MIVLRILYLALVVTTQLLLHLTNVILRVSNYILVKAGNPFYKVLTKERDKTILKIREGNNDTSHEDYRQLSDR